MEQIFTNVKEKELWEKFQAAQAEWREAKASGNKPRKKEAWARLVQLNREWWHRPYPFV